MGTYFRCSLLEDSQLAVFRDQTTAEVLVHMHHDLLHTKALLSGVSQ